VSGDMGSNVVGTAFRRESRVADVAPRREDSASARSLRATAQLTSVFDV
jgi:hypothetical protein